MSARTPLPTGHGSGVRRRGLGGLTGAQPSPTSEALAFVAPLRRGMVLHTSHMAERCGHCGREGTLTTVTNVAVSERPTEIQHGAAIEETTDQTVLLVQRCEVCSNPTLSTFHWIEGWSDPEDYAALERLHPPRQNLEDLPSRVRDRYISMLELLHAPDAFAVRAGRVLEAACTDQGLTSGELGPRLDQLAGRRRQTIPKPLAAQAHLVREFRNIGGHDDVVDVEARDVPLIRGFVEALLEFLYWGPATLTRGREALERRIKEGGGP